MADLLGELLADRTRDVALDPDVQRAERRAGSRSLVGGLQAEEGELDEPKLE
jgi:hypothetical protein